MTHPRATTASARPASSTARAARGSSKAPGTHTTRGGSSPSAPTPRRPIASQAPAMRSPAPACDPTRPPSFSPAANRLVGGSRCAAPSEAPGSATALPARVGEAAEAAQQVAEALALRPQVGEVLGVRGELDRHALDDLESETLEAPVLGGVVGHEPHGGDPEVDEDLGTRSEEHT